MSTNNVVMSGYVGKEIENKRSTKGETYVKFSIAQKEANGYAWYDCVAFRHTAEYILKFVKPRDFVILIGKLQKWQREDQQTGRKNYGVTIIVDSVTDKFTINKQEERPAQYDSLGQVPAPAPTQEISADDLPF